MTWVAGLGQAAAGDDGVGLEVVGLLEQGGLPPGLSLHRLGDATALLPLLASGEPGVVVDAVLASPSGQVRVLSEDALDAAPASGLSSHGISVLQAVRLARAIYPAVGPVRFVAVTIDAPAAYGGGLSPAVTAAARAAAEVVRALAQAGGITTERGELRAASSSAAGTAA